MLEIDEEPDILTECPYCGEEVLIELNPYWKKDTTVFRDGSETTQGHAASDTFPEVIPTSEPEKGESDSD